MTSAGHHDRHHNLLIHSSEPISEELRNEIAEALFRAIEPLEKHIGAITVELKRDKRERDGHVVCRIGVDGWHSGPLVTVESRASDADEAALRALKRVRAELRRVERQAQTDGPLANPTRAQYAFEASPRQRPSRKSTRGSQNRIKAATQLTRRTQRAVNSPKARAARA